MLREPADMRLSSDFRLFCLALRGGGRADDLAALRRGMAAWPDWQNILDGARRHRVAQLLREGLRASQSPCLPGFVADRLREEASAAAARSLAQVQEVARLSRAFERAGVRVLVLKGVTLSAQLFGDPAKRDPRDIDLLADPAGFAAAEAVLIGAGYRPWGTGLSARQAAAYRHWVKDVSYVHAETGIEVELHHRLNDNPRLLPCDFAELWAERAEIAIAGIAVPTLSHRHLALYLCLHGAVHCWEELR